MALAQTVMEKLKQTSQRREFHAELSREFNAFETTDLKEELSENLKDELKNEENKRITYLPVELIKPNPYQPRKFFNEEMLEELSSSIEKYGIMQPINVRIVNKTYELISGERRLRASKKLGLKTIPTIIVNIDDKESSFLALIENLQRENLNYIEEAIGYVNLLNEYSLTQEELSKQVGKSQSAIANKIRILKLPKEILENLLNNGLTERHARSLLKLKTIEQQEDVLKIVIAKKLNVKETEILIEKALNPKKKHKKVKSNPFAKDIRLFTNTIKQSVEIMNASGLETDYMVTETADCYKIEIEISKN